MAVKSRIEPGKQGEIRGGNRGQHIAAPLIGLSGMRRYLIDHAGITKIQMADVPVVTDALHGDGEQLAAVGSSVRSDVDGAHSVNVHAQRGAVCVGVGHVGESVDDGELEGVSVQAVVQKALRITMGSAYVDDELLTSPRTHRARRVMVEQIQHRQRDELRLIAEGGNVEGAIAPEQFGG